MTPAQHYLLFWVFVGFFVVIGTVAILAIVGVIKTDNQFRKWAVVGFAAAITGVVVMWAKAQSPLDIFVNLEPPVGIAADSFELVGGTYEYCEQSDGEKSDTRSGAIELTAGQQVGWWTARIPYSGMAKAVKLKLKDKHGKLWGVRPFYPNYNRQLLIATDSSQSHAQASTPALSLTDSAYAGASIIKFNNYAKATFTQQGRTYYKWRVFVDEPNQVLTRIAEVQYLLHPTFPDPLQVRTNPNDKFAVEASGWGQFSIQIMIKYKDRSTESMTYYLDFNKRWP